MGNSHNPSSSSINLRHFHSMFPSLTHYICDESTFNEIFEACSDTCEFLASRNMDQKDRVYTRRNKELLNRVKEIIKLRSNVVIKKFSDLDMIVDYFSYAIIYGQDVSAEACRPEKVYTYDWSKLVKDIPEKTIRNHLAI